MTASKPHFLAGKKIIVSGSGIAGLSFIVALRKQWDASQPPPEITIYDRDTKDISVEREGYSLSLNGLDENGGLVACRDLGLLDEMLKHAVAGVDSAATFRLWDAKWAELLKIKSKPHDGLPTAGIRIPRRDLRNVLVTAGEGANAINWGMACASTERLDNGRIRVHISPSSGLEADTKPHTEDCDLLIAADGAHSKIRASLRPDDTLDYEGAVQFGGVANFPDGIPEPFDKNWGMAITGEGVGCFFSPVDKTGVVWALSRKEPDMRPKYDRASKEQFEAMKTEALEIGSMFAEPYRAIVQETDQGTSFVIPARDKKPFEHDETLRGVVFIGDSNHAVSPFAGNGANLALKDGWDLATQLCKAESLEAALVVYDKLAVPRAVKTVKTSHSRMGMAHNTGYKHYAFLATMWTASWVMKLTNG